LLSTYSTVFILTNGVSVCEKRIDFLAQITNLHFGLSLDGHDLKMNHYRFKNKTTFDKVMSNFNKLGQSSVPVQINMVMHDLNNGINDSITLISPCVGFSSR